MPAGSCTSSKLPLLLLLVLLAAQAAADIVSGRCVPMPVVTPADTGCVNAAHPAAAVTAAGANVDEAEAAIAPRDSSSCLAAKAYAPCSMLRFCN
jgi:hypothetical protein